MPIRYEAYTAEGEKLSGTLAVDEPAQAEAQLWNSNLVVTSLKRERPLRDELLGQLYHQLPTVFRPRATELVSFTRELAFLLNAGISLHQALALLHERLANPLLKEATETIGKDIQTGLSFSEAVAKHKQIFPPLYTRLLTVGEETGTPMQALNQLADYMERQASLNQKVVAALRYPSLVAVVGLGAGFFMVTVSLPSLTKLLTEFGGKLPPTTRLLIFLTSVIASYGKWALILLALLGAVGWLYSRTEAGARRRDRLMLRLPVVGRVVRLAAMFRFSSTLYTMLSAGLPLVESMELTSRTTGNTEVRDAILAARNDVLQGQSFSQALGHQPVFPQLIPQMVAVGEQSGTLNKNLATLATLFDQETDRSVTAITSMIEPAMILVAGGVVGFIAVGVASALYGSLSQIR